jgi:hypothetical protein
VSADPRSGGRGYTCGECQQRLKECNDAGTRNFLEVLDGGPAVSRDLCETRDGDHADEGRRIPNQYLTPDKMTLAIIGDTKTVQEQVAPWRKR